MSIKRIVVIGPESTGKSTLSEVLAGALQTVWVPEYAREYLNSLDRAYELADLTIIAQKQIESEDRLALQANKYLICDTDLNVIKVWSEAKYDFCDKYILEQIAERKYDLYLLTNIDVEWQDDPLREHPLPAERQYFYSIYTDIVQNSGVKWGVISGNESERLAVALEAISSL